MHTPTTPQAAGTVTAIIDEISRAYENSAIPAGGLAVGPDRLRPYGSANMVSHMKTTVQIPDPLLASAKEVARRDGTTLAALVEEGLRKVVGERGRHGKPFKLEDRSVGGKGMNPEYTAGWDALRDAIYQGRGA